MSSAATKEKIVFSAINITRGGPLTMLLYFHQYASKFLSPNYDVVFVVQSKELLPDGPVSVFEFPDSRKTFFHKLYYEYFGFMKLSRTLKATLWFSLNDITPNVEAARQAVYFHHPTPFYKLSWMDFRFPSRVILQKFYYPFFYRKNLFRNRFIVVQQEFMKAYAVSTFGFEADRVLISKPSAIEVRHGDVKRSRPAGDKVVFFYPTKAEVYKNLHVIVDAVEVMKKQKNLPPFSVVLTITGDENAYARYLKKRMSSHPEFVLTGYIDLPTVMKNYVEADCVIFSSRLETWGLPLTEARHFGKDILASDLPYAHETLGPYDKVKFFNPESAQDLAEKMAERLRSNDSLEKSAPPDRDDARNDEKSLSLDKLFEKLLDRM